jgi:predicted nucleotidyltransferase
MALEPHERRWLDGYVERLANAPSGILKRVVVYGSKARGDAGPQSDVDLLVVVNDVPGAVRTAKDLAHTGDATDLTVDHNIVVQTEARWREQIDKELPFARNVEAEGVQVHPVYR